MQLQSEGMTDADVCNAIGMDPDELKRVKHVTGYAAIFADHEYSQAWESVAQAERRAGNQATVTDE